MSVGARPRQILEGLQFLHDHNIPYGQLHPGNVLLEKGVAKLTDLEIGLLGMWAKLGLQC